MIAITDIPDWCVVEGGLSQDAASSSAPSSVLEAFQCHAAALARLWHMSPLPLAGSVRAPTLLLLGEEDRRVPPSQGLEWYHALRRAGVTSRCCPATQCHTPLGRSPLCSVRMYPKNGHALSKCEAEADAFVNAALWIHQHLQGEDTHSA